MMILHPLDEQALHWNEIAAHPTWLRIAGTAVTALIGSFVMLFGVVAWLS
ncbi:MAG: hypothetical protein J7498_05360 [Sphingobium sp.]|nr:hypothetical protein [Sphingobium sp.]